jgi:hypothetical protein
MNPRLTLLLVALCASTAPLLAQVSPVESALADWRKQHGANWEVFMDTGTGRASFLYGGSAPAPFEPASEADWFTLARGALAQTQELHGIEAATLVEHSTLFQPLGMVGTTDKQTVKFRQLVAGVPVDGGFVNVLFDARGRLLSVQTRALPGIAGLDVVPNYTADEAALRGVAQFQLDQGVVGSVSEEPELVVAQLEDAETRRGTLAYRVSVLYLPADMEPLGTIYYFDAKSGEVLRRDDAIHYLDVGGRVYTMATPGSAPDIASNPETQQVLKYARVQSSAGTVFTNANGDFNFVGALLPLSCTFNYVGTYNNVQQSGGGAYALTTTVPVGTGASVLLNPGSGALETAQANIFQSINVQRDWVRSINPLDNKADFVHTANANIASTCNAFFNGSSINFYQAGGGCVNTGFSTVVAHEDGHWLNVIYGTGNSSDGTGEATADIWAMYIWDTPLVGEGFINGNPVRTGLNTRQFCGDCCSACYGAVHTDGEPLMGAAWKVRRNLKTSNGVAGGGAIANAIFLGYMNSYNQTQIKSVIETQWLTLDDNDGNIQNGTPHFNDIDSGFREQGFPGVTLIPINITNVTQLASTTNQVGPYAVNATMVSNYGSTVASAQLFYKVGNAATYTAVTMAPVGGNVFSGSIPGQIAPKVVSYYVRGTDALGNSLAFPLNAPSGGVLTFSIGAFNQVFCDNFDTNANAWTVANTSLTAGAWVRGVPIGTTQNGAQAQPATDNPGGTGTNCYFTGQGTAGSTSVGEADVDGGPTVLTTPAIDLSSGVAQLSYAYWFYNDDNDADYFKVEVATNAAGTNWVQLRNFTALQGTWRNDTIELSSFVTTTATTRIRFSVSDNPNNSVTEAALDDVCISTLGPVGCQGNVQTYCAAKVNSELCLPAIDFSGIPSLTGPVGFQVTATQVLNQKSGLLYYGYNTKNTPFQGGTMCVEAPLRRTALQNTGGSATGDDCTGTMIYDMNARIRSGADAQLTAGQFVACQYYYRDPNDAFTTGLTNAVSFTICP